MRKIRDLLILYFFILISSITFSQENDKNLA
ncbi:MAG: hypothetical protein ACI9EK_002973, partial [Psychroserpens sp.]